MKDQLLKLIVFALYTMSVIASLSITNLKRATLAYDEVDYAFYAQFAARLADPQLTDAYSAQPQGYNFIGYVGTDGKDNLHQSVHFEGIKYVFALLYRLIPTPFIIAFFIALVYFSPIVYLTWIHPLQNANDRFFVFLFALLYLGIPSVFSMVSHDLRPRILMIPSFTLVILAIHYQRPLPEKFLLFGLLFLIREEALLFGMIILLYNYFRTPPGRERTLSMLGFGLIWGIFLLLIVGYFHWTGYEIDPMYQPVYQFLALRRLFIALIIGSGVAAIILFGVIWFQSRKTPWLKDLLQILAYATIFVPLALQFSTTLTDWLFADNPSNREILDRFLYSSRTTFVFTASILLLLLIRNSLKSSKFVTALQTFFLLIGILLLGLQFTHLSKTLADYKNRANLAEIVFQLRAETDPYTSRILTDYSTYQAFFDYENVTLYQRLPWQLAGEARYYPDNLPYLQQILADGIDTIVLNTENKQDIQDLLTASNLQPVRVVENERYQIIYLP